MNSDDRKMQPLDVTNLRSQIEQRILTAILKGTFRPGDRLIGHTVAKNLGVSLAPVREALSALEREGIVIQVPRRGYFVAELSRKDISEVYNLRLLLEVAALHHIIGRVSKEDLRRLQQLVVDLGQAMEDQSDPSSIVALDLEFHRCLCSLSHHSRLCTVWNSLRLQTQMLIGATSPTHYQNPEEPRQSHQRILDAIVQQDLAAAKTILTEHIRDAEQRAISAFEQLKVQSG
jgi:DNA-binding GntR family transcriptional regulator